MPDFSHIIAILEASKYPLIFIGSYIEGSAVMIGTGVLLQLGQVQFWPAYGALVLGDILADIMWYYVGYFGARPFMNRWGHYIGMTPEVVEKIEKRFHKYHTSILIVSKLTMGFGFAVATLTTAGMMRISFVRYFIINLVGGFIWIFALMMVGYYFGNLLLLVPRELQIAIAVIGIAAALWGLHYASKKLASTDW